MSAALRWTAEITGREIRSGDPDFPLTTFYFTNRAFTTRGDDSIVTDQYFKTRILQAADTESNIFATGTTRGRSSGNTSGLILANLDRQFDFLRRYDIRGIVVRVGLASNTTLSSHQVVTRGVCESKPRFSKQTIEFTIRSPQSGLSQALQQNKYGGTNALPNGVDGTAADLKGKDKPLFYGTVNEWPLVQVNAPKLIYQARDGRVDVWGDTSDLGVTLAYSGTYANQAALENDALQPAPGHYKVWLDGGMCRFGSLPTLPTANLSEGATAADRTHAQIAKRIMLDSEVDISAIRTADITAFDAKNAAEIGIGIAAGQTGEAALDEIAISCGAWWGEDQDFLLRFVRVEAPQGEVAATFTKEKIVKDLITVEATDDPERGLPFKALTFEYGRIYTVQTNPAEDSSLTAEQRAARNAYLKQEFRTVSDTRPSVAIRFQNAASPTIRTLYVHEADALTELARVLLLRKDERARITFTVAYTLENAALDLWELVGMSYPGFDLKLFGYNSGLEFWIIGKRPNARAKRIEITAWGNRLLNANLTTENNFFLMTEDNRALIAEAA